MKLIHAVTNRLVRTIYHFGDAKLICNAYGHHELIGGTISDLVTAKEWVSLFAHEIVFSHSKREPKQRCSVVRNLIPPTLKQQRAGLFSPRKISARIRF